MDWKSFVSILALLFILLSIMAITFLSSGSVINACYGGVIAVAFYVLATYKQRG